MIEHQAEEIVEKEKEEEQDFSQVTVAPKQQLVDKQHLANNKRLLLTALALGWCVDWLFYDKSIGISLVLFSFLAVGALWWNGRYEKTNAIRQNLWLLIPLFFFATMAFIRSNPFLLTLNVLAVLALLAYLVFFYSDGRVHNVSLLGSLLVPLRVGGKSLITTAPILVETIDVGKLRSQGRKRFFPILRGILLAIPILFVFTGLLASADLIFADYVDDALSLNIISDLFEWGWRGLLILLVSWLLAGAMLFALRQRSQINEESLLERGINLIPGKLGLGFTETTTILGLVNLLFFSFVLVQFNYLFGVTVILEESGFTYAEYARRGFFELLTVAVLTLLMILGLNWITQRQNKGQINWFNGLSSSMIGFVLIMLVSAFRRMRLYEAEFGYTELRLQVYLFMGWLGGLLLWFLFTQWRRPDRFAIGFIVVAIGFVATLNLINPDLFIAKKNLVRYQQTGDLDVKYLTTLSDDAMPALFAALLLVEGDDQELARYYGCGGSQELRDYYVYVATLDKEACTATLADVLMVELNGRYQTMSENDDWQQWLSFNLARYQAFNQLQAAFGE